MNRYLKMIGSSSPRKPVHGQTGFFLGFKNVDLCHSERQRKNLSETQARVIATSCFEHPAGCNIYKIPLLVRITQILSLTLRMTRPGMIAIFLCLFLLPLSASAQEFVRGHSTDLVDAKAQFRNPALVSFQSARFFAGAKAYHVGLGGANGIPLRQGFFAVSTPFLFNDYIGVGVGGQYFSSPIFKRSRMGARISGRLDFVSLGIELDALTTGYDQANFTEEALNDPLFAGGTSQTALSVGAGVYAQPFPGFGVSLGVTNLNRPVTSLGGDSTRAAQEVYGGVSYAYGPVRGMLELNNTKLDGTRVLLSVEAYSTVGHFIRATSDFGFDQARIEGQYYVGGPLSINYSYDLPTSELLGPSSGSHQFTVIYEFNRSPSVRPAPPLPPNNIPFSLNDQDADLMPTVYVTAEVDYVEVFEKRIRRRLDPSLPANAIASLSRADIEQADSSFSAYSLPFKVDPIRPLSEDIRFPTPLSDNYESSLSQLAQQLSNDGVEELNIVGREDLVEKAMGLRNRVVHEEGAPRDRVEIGKPLFESVKDSVEFYTALAAGDIIPEETIEYASPGKTEFYLYPFQIAASQVVGWVLDVSDQDGQVVRSFNGQEGIPETINWDWRDSNGGLVAPGVYYYQLSWQGTGGTIHTSNKNRIYVKKFVRQITIEVRQSLDPLEQAPDEVQLLIKN